MQHIDDYLVAVESAITRLDREKVKEMVARLESIRSRHGRVFVLGIGGSAANASHLVNDLRKLCGIESYAPTDNVAELSARTNDDGWDNTFDEWLKVSNLSNYDAIFVLSVGGGNLEKGVSVNLVKAIACAKKVGAWVLGIVGRDDGFTAKYGDTVVVVPVEAPFVTPISEAFQAVIWHALVSHPSLQRQPTKW